MINCLKIIRKIYYEYWGGDKSIVGSIRVSVLEVKIVFIYFIFNNIFVVVLYMGFLVGKV